MKVKPFKLSAARRTMLMLLRPWFWMLRPLKDGDLLPNPIEQFGIWYARATRCFGLEFPEAACLSTIDEDGYPDGRFVLLKGFDEAAFVFFTNVESRKGRALLRCPRAALSFYWEPLHRQVRVQGDVQQIDDAEADAYFASRPRLSQIGAWASAQSRPLACRAVLDQRVREFREKFKGQAVQRPPYWRGFRLTPHRVEFWQLRANRLHDRFLYTLSEGGAWKIERLYP